MQIQSRIAIENVKPQVNSGEVKIKRVLNELVHVTADVLVDGHDIIGVSVLYKEAQEAEWNEVRMKEAGNDAWEATFLVNKQGTYTYKVEGWVDYALNWQHGIDRKIEDEQRVTSELLEGRTYIQEIMDRVGSDDQDYLNYLLDIFKNDKDYDKAVEEAQSERLHHIFYNHPHKTLTNYSRDLYVYVDRKKARFSTWYEFFPRSASQQEGVHGTFKDCEFLLPRVAEMGFDTLYFPPVHPIGEVNRKGKNNTTEAKDGDVGSCWGIGSKNGGHKDIHPELGTVEDFKALIEKAHGLGIEIAMDYALQAAPDHPWVKDHPSWFKWRPDGTVQYAENPPKKYQDILPIYFESEDYKALWDECLTILEYWIDLGIKVFRVDNPHTKPYFFWQWIIAEIKKKHPDIIFLAEAFTKPKVMQQLAKQGYTQSYTYFTWRNNKHELIEYMEDLTRTEQREYMRPNFWPNTPDINPFHLQGANESKHIQRYVLAATLSSNIGIYGPIFEQMISEPLPGKEEYMDSEKFQIRHFDWFKQNRLIALITKINQIRHNHEALQQTNNIKFCHIENENLLAFYKWNDEKTDEVLIVINLDDHNLQQGHVQMPLGELGVNEGQRVQMHDLITGNFYDWYHQWNFVELDASLPFHIFAINT